MALDIGAKTIGVALSDPLKLTARPLTTLQRRDLESDCGHLLELIEEHRIDRCIVGRPRHMDGRPAEVTQKIEPLVERLGQRSECSLEWYDERLSTREAEAVMARLGLPIDERRRRRNEFAAAVILEWYLQECETSSDRPASG